MSEGPKIKLAADKIAKDIVDRDIPIILDKNSSFILLFSTIADTVVLSEI